MKAAKAAIIIWRMKMAMAPSAMKTGGEKWRKQLKAASA
jgi:hypothetical protein